MVPAVRRAVRRAIEREETMGLYDRPYMRDTPPRPTPPPAPRRAEVPPSTLSWIHRLRFRLWLWFHPARPKNPRPQ